jgi:glucan 1,3-beta-glucosidase
MPPSLFSVVATAICAASLALADYPISPGFPYGTDQKVRGVSLGGWLVVEVRRPNHPPHTVAHT